MKEQQFGPTWTWRVTHEAEVLSPMTATSNMSAIAWHEDVPKVHGGTGSRRCCSWLRRCDDRTGHPAANRCDGRQMPILWVTTPGAGPMKRIAIPVIGGVITSAIYTMVLIPVYYTLYKRWKQWRESRRDGLSELEDATTSETEAVSP
ncbi:MAG TPA: hypothetical protein VMM76_16545 [Pirellulaceae bacterium]|nr:hypothetical protein [Pirellulaceae bacterium]